MKKFHTTLLLLVLSFALQHERGNAQNTEGRWSLGLHGGANVWLSEYNTKKPGFSGSMFLRYGLSRSFSLGVLAGFEELKAQQIPMFPFAPDDYLKLNAIPVSLVGWIHLGPGRSFAPYLYAGVGGIFYKREDGKKQPYPDETLKSFVVPVGVGFEAFTSKKVSLEFDFGYRLTDDKTDAVDLGKMDAYATARAGLNFYFGTSEEDDSDDDKLTNGEERRLGTNPEMADTDGDGLKDGEEIRRYSTNPLKVDTDGDTLNDGDEVLKYKTDPAVSDTDADGLSDGDESLKYNTDPLKADSDGDSLVDGDEVLNYKSDPQKVDTDGDGLSDNDEVKVYRTNPTKADSDGDGMGDIDEIKKYKTDPAKFDTDGGGINDGAEIARRSDPLNPKDDLSKEIIILERGKTVILDGVNFTTGSANLTKDSETTLERAFLAMVSNPDVAVEIAGYTDNVGNREINDRLSQRRAQAVKAWLVKKGIASRRMTAVGKGMRDPIASNSTASGRAQNRRIEFHVQK